MRVVSQYVLRSSAGLRYENVGAAVERGREGQPQVAFLIALRR
jgi:hypothetical protein